MSLHNPNKFASGGYDQVIYQESSSQYGTIYVAENCNGGLIKASTWDVDGVCEAAVALGGKTVFREGSYVLSADDGICIAVPSDSEIHVPAGVVLQLANGAEGDIFRCTGVSNVRIYGGGELDGNRANQSSRGYGVYCTGSSSRIVVEGLYIHSHYLDSIQFNGGSANRVDGCRLSDSRVENLRLIDSVENIIVNNEVDASSAGMGIFVDYSASGCERNLFSNNNLHDNALEGIGIESGNDHNLIVGNVSESNGDNGISVSSDFCLVSGNQVLLNEFHGIYVAGSNNSVVGNFVYGNSQDTDNTYDGIRVDGNADENCVQGNIVRHGAGGLANHHKYGIRVDDATCDANFVSNNDCEDSGDTADFSDGGTGTVTAAGNRT